MLSKSEEQYCDACYDQSIQLLKQLASIPAPSHHEEKRAEFCLNWLHQNGMKNAYIDEVKNIVFEMGDTSKDLFVFCAHTDIAFSDTEPICIQEDEQKLYGAGVGDDSANVVHLMLCMKYLYEKKIQPQMGILFVLNSCEEGLGNSQGCRYIVDKYKERIKGFISFDGYLNQCTNCAVGSTRYKITTTCEGGHSYADFGKENAISTIAHIIRDLEQIELPTSHKTTYNFGMIEGGRTINAIAAKASLYYEYRSSSQECLDKMKKQFDAILEKYQSHTVVEVIGIRPGNGPLDEKKHQAFTERNVNMIKEYYDGDVEVCANGTDSNIPLSYGICANTVGTLMGEKAHTYEEWIDLESYRVGLKVMLRIILSYIRG